MKRCKLAILSFSALLFFLMSGSLFAGSTTGLTEDTIKIGMFGAMTGPQYIYGKLAMNGAELIYRRSNEKGGIYGRKIVVVREDDMCKPEGGIGAAKKLIHDHKVFMIHGGACSNAAIAASEEIKKFKVPWLLLDATSDRITDPTHPYVFRCTLAAKFEGASQVDFALSIPDVKRIAIVVQRDAWGMSKYTPMKARMKKLNITPVAEEEMTVDANDATAQVLKIMNAKADVVIMETYPKPTAVFVRDAVKYGFKPIFIAQTGVVDLLSLRDTIGIEGAIDDFYTISQTKYGIMDPALKSYRELLEKYYPGDRFSIFNVLGINGAMVAVEALKKAGPNLTREKVRDAMESIKDFKVDFAPGPITFSPEDHNGLRAVNWLVLRKGKVVNIGTKYPSKK